MVDPTPQRPIDEQSPAPEAEPLHVGYDVESLVESGATAVVDDEEGEE